MKARIDDYMGWVIWCEFEPGKRSAETCAWIAEKWTAEKKDETVILEAPTCTALRELIELKELRRLRTEKRKEAKDER